MTELEHLFRQLVRNLAAIDPVRIRRPVSLADIAETVLPYRANRRALGIDSSEDYELLLLRLAAGEGGFARTSPDEARARFEEESRSTNPDLGVIRVHGEALLTLAAERIARALGAEAEERYAPPTSRPAPPPPRPNGQADGEPESESGPESEELQLDAVRRAPAGRGFPDRRPSQEPAASTIEGGYACGYCGGGLPSGRAVNFCPHCGQSQSLSHCPGCRQEVELGWHYCVNCGYSLGER